VVAGEVSTGVEADTVVEAGGNMIAKTITMILAVATGSAFAQQKTFETPEAAAQALINAASKNDAATLTGLLGPSGRAMLTSGNAKQDEAERQEFAKIANEKHHLEQSSMNSHVRILLIGDQDWPFPIPLVEERQRWRFDSARGSMEMQARELGANELDAIEACAAYVSAQQSYAEHKRSAAGTQEYAENISSLPVPKEFAAASAPNPTRPYHGYYFRVLKSGRHPYVAGNVMLGGFAIMAWPAQYGVTGVHTFIVNQTGVVYEKDRGAHPTAEVTRYDPDPSWMPVD
jgi:Protein of unknown function (DUF2950)